MMHNINSVFLLTALAMVSLFFLVKYLRENWASITHRDDTPIGKAKRAWSKAKKGTQKKNLLEFELDLLIVKKMSRATTLCMLYNAYEEAVTYTSFFGIFQRQREVTTLICTAYTNKKEKIQDEMAKAEKERELDRRNQTKDVRAPRPQRIERREQKCPGNVCNIASLQKRA